ncbi:hypothetical protein E5D57_013042 [Metarhizium anisopliae]|nr:hypothetical protein E5D57_013042 [Metarhizium anisopliae]
MGQTFELIAPHARLTVGYGGKLGNMLDDGMAETLVGLLTVPARPRIAVNPDRIAWPTASLSSRVSATVAVKRKVNVELRKCPPRLLNKTTTTAGRLFSDAELETLRKEKIAVFDRYEGWYDTMTLSNLYAFTTPKVSDTQKRLDMHFETVGLAVLLSMVPSSENAALTYLGPSEFPSYRQYFPQDQPWILRNLTTKQFVRAEAIALKQEFIHGPDIDVLGFGHAVLLRICWSSRPVPHVDPENIARGIWAGHCFDITMLAKHQEKTGAGEGWTDISDEVAKEIATFCETNLGPAWRSILCQNKGAYSFW